MTNLPTSHTIGDDGRLAVSVDTPADDVVAAVRAGIDEDVPCPWR